MNENFGPFKRWALDVAPIAHRLGRACLVLIQEGRDPVTHAIFNAIAMRKILEKYYKSSGKSKDILFTLAQHHVMNVNSSSRTGGIAA